MTHAADDGTRRLRILHIEDSAFDAELVSDALEGAGLECEIVRVDDRGEFLDALEAGRFDVVLCDYSLPAFDGLSALGAIRERMPDVPFLFVSGTIGEERAVESMKNGATDYVLKDHLARLPAAVRRALAETRERAARRHAEDELAESRRFVERVIQSTPNLVYVYDHASRRNVFVNQQIAGVLGYPPDEVGTLGGDFPTALVHADDRGALEELFERMRSAGEGEVVEAEFRLRRRSGDWRWLHARQTVFARDRDGSPSRVLGVAEDVTERRRAERQRSAQYALTKLLADSGSWRDAAPAVLECLCGHLGFELGEVWTQAPGQRALQAESFWHRRPAEREAWASASRSLRCGQGEDVAGRIWQSGRAGWLDIAALPGFTRAKEAARLGLGAAAGVPLAGGRSRPAGVLVLYAREQPDAEASLAPLLESIGSQLAEFLERKRGEERIREQAALLESANEAILVEDLTGRITYWNHGAEQLYGCSSEGALGRTLDTLLHPGPLGALHEARRRMREQGDWTGVLEQRTRDGREVVVQSHWTLVRDEYGQPRSALIINTDVTEARRLEAEFLRAQRMESIGALAGGIAHDLNNVLSPIVMAVDLLRRRIADPAGQRILNALDTSARRGVDLVQQVLTFARGGQRERAVVQPGHLLREMEKIVRETFPKSIQVGVDVQAGLWSVMAEATPLHQVLMNLCVNARDAMAEGGVLSLTAENVSLDEAASRRRPGARPGAYVVLTVSDTGAGIPSEIRERIFDPFFTTKGVGRGTGLGLSTALSIVKNHGGFIDVHSEPGRGTTFQVHLPGLQGDPGLASAAEEEPLPAGAGELILVVDDEASLREIAREILETHGYTVLQAGDGHEALESFARARAKVDLVLMDLSMPNLGGREAIRALRDAEPALPIVAASGLSSGRPEVEAMGVDAFLAKPYTARKLLGVLSDVLRRRS
jgi:PAS domain S-box-containing protein